MIVKKLFPHQGALIQAPFAYTEARFFFLIAGYAAGKTSALVDSVIHAVQYFSGKTDLEGRQPKIGICGITLTFLKKTFVGALLSTFNTTKSTYRYDKVYNVIYVSGVELHLTPIINEEDIFGYDWCCAFIDELDELPTYTANAVVTAINDRCRQRIAGSERRPFLSFATTSQGLKGTYQTVQKLKSKGVNHVIIRGRTKDNKALPKEYVDTMYTIYNEKECRCLLNGEFISIDSGLTYPDYDPTYNKLDYSIYDTILPHENIYIGQDFNAGFNKAVAIVVRDGVIYIAKEYSFPDIRRAPEVFRYDFKENRIHWIPDATYNHHLPEFKKELRNSDIRVKYRSKNPLIKDRTFLINKLFYAERMFTCVDTPELDNGLQIRQNDPMTGMPMKGKGEAAPDHLSDPLEYACSYVAAWLPELKDLYKVVLGRRIKNLKDAGLMREDEDSYKEFNKEASLNRER